MSNREERTKGAALARKFGAPKTAAAIIATEWCYARIFQSAVEEIGTAKLVEALAKEKNAEWAFYALRSIPNLTEAQRTTLCNVITATKNPELAFYALRYMPDLTEAQRTKLTDVIAATKDANWAYHALRSIPNLTEAQRSALQKVATP